ncbi:hypothetical protein J1605_002300 [Eschrichtius robustus]|uniref:Uncharacterized protein n=1 Tax=Eschrichtius robustus TaxID=9764 RepID=A0AB34HWP5_ESCRO|nr:hypothetical protein J1605_002300 [Eschrichtius robustus]
MEGRIASPRTRELGLCPSAGSRSGQRGPGAYVTERRAGWCWTCCGPWFQERLPAACRAPPLAHIGALEAQPGWAGGSGEPTSHPPTPGSCPSARSSGQAAVADPAPFSLRPWGLCPPPVLRCHPGEPLSRGHCVNHEVGLGAILLGARSPLYRLPGPSEPEPPARDALSQRAVHSPRPNGPPRRRGTVWESRSRSWRSGDSELEVEGRARSSGGTRAHTLSVLFILTCVLGYVTLLEETPRDTAYNTKRYRPGPAQPRSTRLAGALGAVRHFPPLFCPSPSLGPAAHAAFAREKPEGAAAAPGRGLKGFRSVPMGWLPHTSHPQHPRPHLIVLLVSSVLTPSQAAPGPVVPGSVRPDCIASPLRPQLQERSSPDRL